MSKPRQWRIGYADLLDEPITPKKVSPSHTKGPWRLYKGRTFCSIMAGPKQTNNEVVHWVGFDSSHFPMDRVANAQRIVSCVNALEGFADPSAAPDLLEAAKLAEKWIFENASGEVEPEAYRALKQAIAKAEGTK